MTEFHPEGCWTEYGDDRWWRVDMTGDAPTVIECYLEGTKVPEWLAKERGEKTKKSLDPYAQSGLPNYCYPITRIVEHA